MTASPKGFLLFRPNESVRCVTKESNSSKVFSSKREIRIIELLEFIEKFLDLKEEEFKGFDYEKDKSSKLVNKAYNDRQLSDGIDFVNRLSANGGTMAQPALASGFDMTATENKVKMKSVCFSGK